MSQHVPRQIFLTQRQGVKIVRMVWTTQSTHEETAAAFDFAVAQEWMMHVFDVDDDTAWEACRQRHKEIEAYDSDS